MVEEALCLIFLSGAVNGPVYGPHRTAPPFRSPAWSISRPKSETLQRPVMIRAARDGLFTWQERFGCQAWWRKTPVPDPNPRLGEDGLGPDLV